MYVAGRRYRDTPTWNNSDWHGFVPRSHGQHYLRVYRWVCPLEEQSVLSGVSLSLSNHWPVADNRIGLITAGFCNLCIATSLAEFLSAYPTSVLTESFNFWWSCCWFLYRAGGQYHWVAGEFILKSWCSRDEIGLLTLFVNSQWVYPPTDYPEP